MHGGGYEVARDNDEELINIVMNARSQLESVVDVDAGRGALERLWPLWISACHPDELRSPGGSDPTGG